MSTLKDLATGKIDIVLVMFMIGFLVACVKLLLTGNTVGPITFGPFNGSDFALVIGALGGTYTLRKHSDNIVRKGGGGSNGNNQ